MRELNIPGLEFKDDYKSISTLIADMKSGKGIFIDKVDLAR